MQIACFSLDICPLIFSMNLPCSSNCGGVIAEALQFHYSFYIDQWEFCKEELSIPCFLFVYSIIYISLGSTIFIFILWVLTQCYCYLFFIQIVSELVIASSFQWASAPCQSVCLHFFFFFSFLLVLLMLHFPCLVLESTTSPRSALVPFTGN